MGQCGKPELGQAVRAPYQLNIGEDINFIACGGVHTMLLTRGEGRVFVMGSN